MFRPDDYWAHGPIHKLTGNGVYMVTAGTLYKKHLFNTPEKLTILQDQFFTLVQKYDWQPLAWSFLINHYHFIARSPETAINLSVFISELHTTTASAINDIDNSLGRSVWYQYWDKHLTFEKSYLARLKYVNTNPVHHHLVLRAEEYPWRSAAWFNRTADRAFKHTVSSFKIDMLKVYDEF